MGEVQWQGQGPPMQRKGEAQENKNVQPLALPPMAGTINPPPAGLTNAGAVPQGPVAQQGAAGIPPAGQVGMANVPPVRGNHVTPPHEYSGIASALTCLTSCMTDADTSHNLRWQRDVNGDAAKVATWQIEATSLPGLHFFAYMQPGEAFLSGGTLSVHNLLNRHRYSVLPWQDCLLLWGPKGTRARWCCLLRAHSSGGNAWCLTTLQPCKTGMPTTRPNMGSYGNPS